MLVDSESIVHQYMMKYVHDTFQCHNSKYLRMEKLHLSTDRNIREAFDAEDLNYVLILSSMSIHRQKNFIRFFQVYMHRIYGISDQSRFEKSNHVDWNQLSKYINQNEVYKQLFFSCLNVYI